MKHLAKAEDKEQCNARIETALTSIIYNGFSDKYKIPVEKREIPGLAFTKPPPSNKK